MLLFPSPRLACLGAYFSTPSATQGSAIDAFTASVAANGQPKSPDNKVRCSKFGMSGKIFGLRNLDSSSVRPVLSVVTMTQDWDTRQMLQVAEQVICARSESKFTEVS